MEGGHWGVMRQTESVCGGKMSKNGGTRGGKKLGLWETGPREIPMVPPHSISLAWLSF